MLRLLGTWTFLLTVGVTVPLWYLGASALAVILITLSFRHSIKTNCVILISVILYILGLLGDSYYGFIEPLKSHLIPKIIMVGYDNIFVTTRNGMFFGFIFVLMGALFAHKRIIMSNAVAFLGLITSILLLITEVYLLHEYSSPRDYNMLLSLVPTIFFLFYLASHMRLKNRAIFKKLRVIGVLVFFMHMFVAHFVTLFISRLTNQVFNLLNLKFVLTVLITTFISITIEELSQKEKFKWLRYLYS